MQQFVKKMSIGVPALLLAFSVLAIAPAFAVEGPETNESTPKTNRGAEFRQEAQDKVAELRKQHKSELSDSARQNRCNGRKVGIQNRFDNIYNKSVKIQDKITGFYDKGTTFATDNNLTPENYDTLKATADAAKATLAADIQALKDATPTINCDNPDIATSIQTFKTAAEQVKKDLKAYRTAVHDVLASIRAAAEATKPAETTEGSDQ